MPRTRHALPLLCLALAGCAPSVLPPDVVGPSNGWQIFHPLPGGYDLYDARSLVPGSVWSVGAHGVIVHWDGTTVRRVDSPVTVPLLAVDGWARDDMYACGGDVLLRYDGRSWDISHRFDDAMAWDLHCAADGRLYVATDAGLWCRENGSWRLVDGPERDVTAVWSATDGRVRAAAGSVMWKLVAGAAVPEQDFGDDYEVRDGDGDWLWLERTGGDDSFRRRSADGEWVARDATTTCAAIADLGELVYAHNAGIVRQTRVWANRTGRWIYGLSAGPDGEIIACGYGGTLMAGVSEADSVRWNESALGLGFRHMNAFDGTGCDDLWAAEWYGRLLHFDGTDWTLEFAPLAAGDKVGGVQVLAGGWVVARGGDEVAVRSPADGWTGLPSPGSRLLRACAVAPDSIIAVTMERFSVWGGAAWRDAGPTAGICWGFP